MTSIAKDWQDSMSEVDGWAEATESIYEDDVKRWNEDKKLDPQKSKSALAMAVTSVTMKNYLFCDNAWLKAHAEPRRALHQLNNSHVPTHPAIRSCLLQPRAALQYHVRTVGGLHFVRTVRSTAASLTI